MQAPSDLSRRLDLLATVPTVGGLMALCEENYDALLRLAPALPSLTGRLVSKRDGQPDLLIEIIDQAPYTTTLRLTHRFAQRQSSMEHDGHLEPYALLRVYHDAEQVEVLDLRQTVLPLYSTYHAPALAAKWKANVFLSKWLGWCVREGHRFPGGPSHIAADPHCELLPSL
jgi:uncharacterized protein YqiB (DUF1249 family)